MEALKDRRVQLALVGLVVAVAAVYGVVVDEQALLAVVALLAAAAGGIAGRVTGAIEAQEQVERAEIQRGLAGILDTMEKAQAQSHAQAMETPFIYPDTTADAHVTYDIVEMAEDIGILSQRVATLESIVEQREADS